MIPLADLLQTKNTTGNTGNTGNAVDADQDGIINLYPRKTHLQEMHGRGEPGIGKSPPRGQKSLGETTDRGEPPPASPGATSYQGPASFETCYQRCLADLGGKYRASMGEVLTDQEREEERRIEADIERLWSLGVSQDEAGAAGTFQEFRAAVIRWYRLWVRGIERSLTAVPTPNPANPTPVDGNLPPSDQDEYRTERAAILEHDAGLPQGQAEQKAVDAVGPCLSCRGGRFWVSVHGPVVCGACHPPADPGKVTRWIDCSGGEA